MKNTDKTHRGYSMKKTRQYLIRDWEKKTENEAKTIFEQISLRTNLAEKNEKIIHLSIF